MTLLAFVRQHYHFTLKNDLNHDCKMECNRAHLYVREEFNTLNN